MFYVIHEGQVRRGVTATANVYRGCAVFESGWDNAGNREYDVPNTSAEAAKACFLINFKVRDGVEYSDSADGADKAPYVHYPCEVHYGGTYRTSKCVVSTVAPSIALRTGDYDTAFPWVSSASGTVEYAYVMTRSANLGYLAPHLHSSGGFASTTRSYYHANFWLKDAQFASARGGADNVQQTSWVEVESIPDALYRGHYNARIYSGTAKARY